MLLYTIAVYIESGGHHDVRSSEDIGPELAPRPACPFGMEGQCLMSLLEHILGAALKIGYLRTAL